MPAPSVVQTATGHTNTATTTCSTQTTLSKPTSGNLLIVFCGTVTNTAPQSVTDNLGNAYTFSRSFNNGSTVRMNLYYRIAGTNEGTTVTQTMSANQNQMFITVLEIAGANTGTAGNALVVDTYLGITGTNAGAYITTPGYTVATMSDELAIVAVWGNGAAGSAISGNGPGISPYTFGAPTGVVGQANVTGYYLNGVYYSTGQENFAPIVDASVLYWYLAWTTSRAFTSMWLTIPPAMINTTGAIAENLIETDTGPVITESVNAAISTSATETATIGTIASSDTGALSTTAAESANVGTTTATQTGAISSTAAETNTATTSSDTQSAAINTSAAESSSGLTSSDSQTGAPILATAAEVAASSASDIVRANTIQINPSPTTAGTTGAGSGTGATSASIAESGTPTGDTATSAAASASLKQSGTPTGSGSASSTIALVGQFAGQAIGTVSVSAQTLLSATFSGYGKPVVAGKPGSVAVKAKSFGSVSVDLKPCTARARAKAKAGVQALTKPSSVRAKAKWSNVSASSETRKP